MQKYLEYNKDESGLEGFAINYYFPQSLENICEIVRKSLENSETITVQGGKTGIMGGAIPLGGNVLNLSKFNNFIENDENTITVQAGMTLQELNAHILHKYTNKFFPIIPTEELATIGGMVATNARGLHASKYGNIIDYIEEIELVFPDGRLNTINRNNKDFSMMIGSEGSLGIITQIKLKLISKKSNIWGISFFFEEELSAFSFIEALQIVSKDLSAVEFIDRACLDLLENKKANSEKIKKMPNVSQDFQALVYIEIESDNEEEIESIVENLIEIGSEHKTDPDNAWIFDGYNEVQKMRDFRHAIMEFTLMSSPFTLPFNLSIKNTPYGEVIKIIKEKFHSIEKYFFGHADNSIVFCMLSLDNKVEFEQAHQKLDEIFTSLQNSDDDIFISEYGIGKLNSAFVRKFSKNKFEEILKNQKEFDGKNIMNSGNYFKDFDLKFAGEANV